LAASNAGQPFFWAVYVTFFIDQHPWVILLLLFATSLSLMLASGNLMIAWLRNRRWRKDAETWTVREDTPDSHLVKQGTPSMGGIGIIACTIAGYLGIILSLFIWDYIQGSIGREWLELLFLVLILPVTMLLHGLLGFGDDWSKATGRGGLRARAKLLCQLLLAAGFVAVCFAIAVGFTHRPNMDLPLGQLYLQPIDMALIFCCLVVVLIGTGNAVNLTDGIDGLAAGLTTIAALGLWLNHSGQVGVSIIFAAFCAAMIGACLGFLNFNRHKARVFMGDTGSLALGATLAAAAILLRAVPLLPFIGFIFYVEAASVTLQVLYFKWTKRRTGEGKRLFRRAPLHHHFELGGWSEWRVVLTFWAINLVTTGIGLGLRYMGVLPQWP
jgi:phospho-N-acetylmuramoyl-pentapeptide-transferase